MIRSAWLTFTTDLFLARTSWRTPAFVALPAIAASLRVAFGKFRLTTEAARDALAGRTVESTGDTSAYGPFVDGLAVGLAVLVFVILAVAAHGIAAERERGTIRHLLIQSVDRIGLVIGRLAWLHFLGVLAVGLALLSSLATSALLHDFVPVMEDGFELIPVDEIHAEIVLGLALALTPLPALIAFGVCVSVYSRSAVEAVCLALGVWLAFDVLKSFLGDSGTYVFAYYLPAIVDESYLKDSAKLARGLSDVFREDGIVRLNWWTPLPAFAMFSIVSAFGICRRRM